MERKKLSFEDVTKLYFDTKESMIVPENWMRFLNTAGQNYRLPFGEQVLVFAQRPDTTALLTTENWNHRFGRWINRGSVGIAVLDLRSRGIGRLKYYFDISDTHTSKYSRLVPVWRVLPEFQQTAIDALENSFGPLDKSTLLTAIWGAAQKILAENFERYWEMLLAVKNESQLADVPDTVLRQNYRDLLELSVVYCTARRCGLDVSQQIRPQDFAAIALFDTLETVNGLGVPTASMTRTALDAIAPEMRLLYRRWELEHQHEQDNTERSADDNGRAGDDGARGERKGDPLSDGERVLAPGAGVPGAEAGVSAEYVGTGTHEVSGGAGAAAPDESGDQRGTAGLSDGSAESGGGRDGGHRGASDEAGGRDGGAEASGSDGVGTPDGEHPSQSTRSRDGRGHLPVIPSPEEQQNSIAEMQEEAERASSFAFPQADVDEVLRRGTLIEGGTYRIVYHLTHQESKREAARLLAEEFGIGGYSHTFSDGVQGWVEFDAKGLQLRSGDTKLHLSWAKVGDRIRTLIRDGYYLTGEEKVGYAAWLDQEHPGEHEPEQISITDLPPVPVSTAQNYHITGDNPVGTPSERYKRNVAAIRLLHTLEAENRQATPEEQTVLAQYVGWGGLADCFDERHSRYLELKTLLTDAEYAAARESTLTAFFTPPAVIQAIYQGLENLSFQTGNILEPSCGVGSFMGLLPEPMRSIRFTGVELDSISGRIARQLYPEAHIVVQGYENTDLPDDYFDAAVGNVPFGQFKVIDDHHKNQNWYIHDYFFGKSLDKVRPGGVIAFITSKGTLDKENPAVRRYIAQRAELLGAIRLPNNTFKSAGTKVTSDIIFLQKRERPVEIEPDWVHLGMDENGVPMNAYFVEHPKMILGEMQMVSGPYGSESACLPREGADLAELLSEAVAHINGRISDRELTEINVPTAETEAPLPDPNLKNFSFCVVDDEVYFKENGRLLPVELSATEAERVKGMVAIRDCVQQLIRLETEDYPLEQIQSQQTRLNELYDVFSVKYGQLVDRANAQLMREDASYPLLASLENTDEQGHFVGKADIFSKRTIKPVLRHDNVSTAADALEVSMADRARVDMDYMCQLTGKPESELYADLQGVIFLNPDWEEGRNLDKYLTADEYLSGPVRQKLRLAKLKAETEPEVYGVHVAALEAVQPKDLEPTEIGVRLGATWLPEDVVEQFGFDLFKTPFYAQYKMHVRFEPYTSAWRIEGKSMQFNDVRVTSVYGTSRINGWEILEQTLNLKDVTIYDYYESDGKKKAVMNAKETTLARGKQEEIRQQFADWIWADPERRERLCSLYNEQFNSTRAREYDGSFLEFAGINPEIKLRPHQVNAIARVLLGGNTLLAHVVGAGKTYEMVAAAMESKRLGLCHKSMVVVPNHLVEQWATEWMQLYPAANILVAHKRDFEQQHRRAFCSRIATGDYDAVILGHSQFEKIPLSLERQRRTLEEQLDEIMDMIVSAKSRTGGSFSVKQLERERKNVEAKLKKLNDQSRKDDVLTFEELGIDRLFVDEAHYFKNLAAFTKMHNVGGITQTEAQKSSDLYMKCRYMDELTGGRGIIFATGTPISNTMVEMYTMQRYLQLDTLRRRGISNFDAWASTFGETVTATELSPTGTGYRAKTRFAKFYNLPELMQMFQEVADIQTADMLQLPVPEVERQTVVLKPSEEQRRMVTELGERAERIHSNAVSSSEDNMLLITNDGRKLALDQRLIDPTLPASPTGKSAACAANVYVIWLDSAEQRSTQLVFCDLSTPGDGFNIYDDLKAQLVARGIPETEIAFIHSAKTEGQKQALFSKVNAGQVRVLIGSTFKMGAGTNVQKRLIALHHLECPWRPSDLQQREGRIVRQGNENPSVRIFTYVTEGTFDAYLYQMVESKQKFIGQIMTSKSPVRSAEDVDEQALNYAEIKALSSGDERIKEKMDLDVAVAKLQLMKSSHLSQRFALEDKINKELPRSIVSWEECVRGYQQDVETAAAHAIPDENNFYGMVVQGRSYTDKKAAGVALLTALSHGLGKESVTLGSYRGFELQGNVNVFSETETCLCGALRHSIVLSTDIFGNFTRLDNLIKNLPNGLTTAEQRLQNTRAQLEQAKEEVKKPFPREEELRQKQARLNELNIALNLDRPESELADTGAPEQPSKQRKIDSMSR